MSDLYFQRRANDDRPIILVQNYHSAAAFALIRDFKKIGLRVVCPDSNWMCTHYASNEGLGGELISQADFMTLPPCRVLVACQPQAAETVRLARSRSDRMILNVAQHNNYYEEGLGNVLICPDIVTYEHYPSEVRHKLLYFPKPHLYASPTKDIERCFAHKTMHSFINMPDYWPIGTRHLNDFIERYPFTVRRFGYMNPDGLLDSPSCNQAMSEGFFTVHFKEREAYGLSCLESMSLGTPVISLKYLMENRTLGRYFLDDTNSINADTVGEAIDRALSLSLSDYQRMSENFIKRVQAMTSDSRTVDKLRDAIFD